MQHFKYILFPAETPLLCETPVIFPPWLSHRKVKNALCDMMRLPEPTSAGFVRIVPTSDSERAVRPVSAICYGESDSLKLSACPQDSEFIEGLLG